MAGKIPSLKLPAATTGTDTEMLRSIPVILIPFLLGIAPASLRADTIINQWCPVTPEESADSFFTTEYEGKMIGLCCRSCVRDFERDPEAYLHNLPGYEADEGAAASGPELAADQDPGYEHPAHHLKSNRFWGWIGKFHVLSVHFPIALLLVAGPLEFAGAWRKRDVWIRAARIVFVLGALSAVLTGALGWIAAAHAEYPSSLQDTLELHRWLGTSVTVLALAGLALLGTHIKNPSKGVLLAYRAILLLLLLLVPLASHFGGSLVFGIDYLKF